MAFVRAQEASSSNTSPSPCTYHVFLSFRGDTRKTFTDHLYTALVNASFHVFRDGEELERGEGIKPGLQKAIQKSRSSVILFSKDYASSRWCLDELVMILERKRTSNDHVVLPVFYHVDPSHVRNQTGSFAEAFARHERTQSIMKVNEWRAALREVADLAGMELKNEADGHEAKFIKKIVNVIEDKLRRTPLSVAPYLVGIHSRVEHINLWLQDESPDVGIFVIYGMRGIGKTTIAKHVYNSNYPRFQGSSFLENIREVSEQFNGLVQIQIQLLCDILKGREVKIQSVSEGLIKIRDAISSIRVLLVLDDIDHMDQVDAVLRMRDQFHPGSRIIITTSCAGLLTVDHHKVKVHNVKPLDDNESLELLSWYAFRSDHPIKGYMEHSKRLVLHSQSLPLALKVLGSSLNGKSIEVWKSSLEKLEAFPNSEILSKLRISYDSLQDDHDKNLFLDIACFFIGEEKDLVVKILDGCDFYTVVGMQSLIDRCLLTIDEDGKVQMHHMIRDMGREIVRQESEEPGKRSRLWHDKDSFKVLTEGNGTETIEGLVLNINRQSTPDTLTRNLNTVVLETKPFSRMHKLRLLQLSDVQLNGSYEEFPKGLRWLSWSKFPFDSIPCDFPMENLVVLEMRYSKLRQIWKGKKYIPSLKILDLSHSHDIIETPDFSQVPNLERLILADCASLVHVGSIGMLERLVELDLKDCTKIKKLPMSISMLQLLETLTISRCLSLDTFPREMWKMKSLKVLEANNVPLNKLMTTNCDDAFPRLLSLSLPPSRIGIRIQDICWSSLPSSLVSLSLKNCNLTDDAFPTSLSNLTLLQILNLDGNPICSLPDCIRGLTSLHKLTFGDCTRLKSLVRLPRVEETLDIMGCTSLEKVTFQSISCMPSCYHYSDHSNLNLSEIGYYYKLEPIATVDAEMIKVLGLCNLASMETIMTRRQPMFFWHISVKEMQPIQGLSEFGIFSTFLSGNKVPGQFSHKSTLGSISLTVSSLPNHRIRGLNIFSVYTTSNSDDRSIPLITTKVHNKSKALKWIYGPTWLGIPGKEKDDLIRLKRSQCGNPLTWHEEIPGKGEDMVWLSHWELGNQLESGDEVTVSVHIRAQFKLKECGILLVQEKQEEMRTHHNTKDPCYPYVIGGNLSPYQVMPGTFFLCHLGSFPRRYLEIHWPNWLNCFIKSLDKESTGVQTQKKSEDSTENEEEQQSSTEVRSARGWRELVMPAAFFLLLTLVAGPSVSWRKK